jgi:hypothetical protein
VKDSRGIQGNAKCCEERHPSSPRMLDRMLVEKQAQQQAADKDALLNFIFVRGKNLFYNSPQEKMKGG